MDIDQDNLRTGTARLSRVSWVLLKLLVYRVNGVSRPITAQRWTANCKANVHYSQHNVMRRLRSAARE